MSILFYSIIRRFIELGKPVKLSSGQFSTMSMANWPKPQDPGVQASFIQLSSKLEGESGAHLTIGDCLFHRREAGLIYSIHGVFLSRGGSHFEINGHCGLCLFLNLGVVLGSGVY